MKEKRNLSNSNLKRMKDVRNNDLVRKLSQIRGVNIHTLEFRLFKNEIAFEEINIRCVVKMLTNQITEEKKKEISIEMRKKVHVRTLFEFYSVLSMITEEKKDEVHIIGLENERNTAELLNGTDFMCQMRKIECVGDLCHILMTHAEVNSIEGLEKEISEATIVISFRMNHEIIIISD